MSEGASAQRHSGNRLLIDECREGGMEIALSGSPVDRRKSASRTATRKSIGATRESHASVCLHACARTPYWSHHSNALDRLPARTHFTYTRTSRRRAWVQRRERMVERWGGLDQEEPRVQH